MGRDAGWVTGCGRWAEAGEHWGVSGRVGVHFPAQQARVGRTPKAGGRGWGSRGDGKEGGSLLGDAATAEGRRDIARGVGTGCFWGGPERRGWQ